MLSALPLGRLGPVSWCLTQRVLPTLSRAWASSAVNVDRELETSGEWQLLKKHL